MALRSASMKAIGFKVALLGILWIGHSLSANAQKMDICQIYGAVYVTKDAKEADFVLFVEESEAFADLVVFLEDNKLYADEKGLWFYTKAINFAQYVVYITDKKDLADFSVYYTKTPAFAGCRK